MLGGSKGIVFFFQPGYLHSAKLSIRSENKMKDISNLSSLRTLPTVLLFRCSELKVDDSKTKGRSNQRKDGATKKQ